MVISDKRNHLRGYELYVNSYGTSPGGNLNNDDKSNSKNLKDFKLNKNVLKWVRTLII